MENVDLMTDEEVSKLLGLAKGTLAQWRHAGTYQIPYVKVGRLVRYFRSDIQKWVESRREHKDSEVAETNE